MKIVKRIIIALILISLSLTCMFSCEQKKKGDVIPYGTYKLYENGEIQPTSYEHAWHIYSKIECIYAEYDFIQEEDGTMYFQCQIEQKQKYLVKYDDETKILSIYLPSNMYTSHQESIYNKDNYIWMNFKKD